MNVDEAAKLFTLQLGYSAGQFVPVKPKWPHEEESWKGPVQDTGHKAFKQKKGENVQKKISFSVLSGHINLTQHRPLCESQHGACLYPITVDSPC